jgi:hypothetical protein
LSPKSSNTVAQCGHSISSSASPSHGVLLSPECSNPHSSDKCRDVTSSPSVTQPSENMRMPSSPHPDMPSRQTNGKRLADRLAVSTQLGSSNLKSQSARWSSCSPQRAIVALDALDALSLRGSSSPSPSRLTLPAGGRVISNHEPLSPSPFRRYDQNRLLSHPQRTV